MHIITYSTLFPNDAQRFHGLFVERRLVELKRRLPANYSVVAPIPWFPFTSSIFGAYSVYARAPRVEDRNGQEVRHPRYPVIPKIGMAIAPWMLARWTRAEVERVRQQHAEPAVLDAHYLYPDGVAAMLIAKQLGLPCVLTARGTDLNVIARFSTPRR